MFTGIVQAVCRVTAVERAAGITNLTVALGGHAGGLRTGGSVAVNGCCLTATTLRTGGDTDFHLIQETLSLSNLGALAPGDLVNVERSFRVGEEVGGHILSGHIATSVPVVAIERSEGHRVLTMAVEARWLRYVMPKGFVALNGASLTVAQLDREAGTMAVSLIPETLARTTFDGVAEGDRINLEVDAQTQAVVDTVLGVMADKSLLQTNAVGNSQ